MAPSKLKRRLGTYISSSVGGETVRVFIPPPLPPVPDPLLNTLHQHLSIPDHARQDYSNLIPLPPLTLLPLEFQRCCRYRADPRAGNLTDKSQGSLGVLECQTVAF